MVKLFKKYLSFIAPGDFYKRPLTGKTINFSKQNIGVNTLNCYVKNMFINAKIDTSERFITGHSGKRTLCTKLYNEGLTNRW